MAIKFQYNKTSLQQLEKQLKMRVRTLPIIKNKESALRMEVKKCKAEAAELARNLEAQIQAYEAMFALWSEFDPTIVGVKGRGSGREKDSRGTGAGAEQCGIGGASVQYVQQS